MKFLPLASFDDVTKALNFNTPDCQVIGGCDLYTTKAAGSDKKLYKNIENSLESQYESLLRLSASVSPPTSVSPSSLNLSRASPFGPLSQVSSRRTFAYLIATLNASHPDYDFSHNLRPADFRKERSLKAVINTLDSTLFNLRPNSGTAPQVPPQTTYATLSSAPATNQTWGPQMWSMIDKEMTLKDCSVYCWAPPDEPFEGDEGSIWSLNYFFFNKDRKRVAYIYVRGVPVVTHSPRQRNALTNRKALDSGNFKRARYWFGDRAAKISDVGEVDQDEDDVRMWDRADEAMHEDSEIMLDDTDFCDEYDEELDCDDEQDFKDPVRDMSEELVASMEMEY